MKRNYVSSLYFRLALILTAGLIMVVSVGLATWFYVVYLEEDRNRETSIKQISDHVSKIIDYMAELPPREREFAVTTLNQNQYYTVQYLVLSEKLRLAPFDISDPLFQTLKRKLRITIKKETPIEFGMIESEEWERLEGFSGEDPEENQPNLLEWEPFMDAMEDEDEWDDQIYTMQIQLDQKQTLVVFFFDFIDFSSFADFVPIEVMLLILSLILSALVLTFFGVRQVTRPLDQLAKLTESLGENIEQSIDPALRGPKEVVTIAYALKEMQWKIIEQIKEKSQFFAAISHDLKTPLTRLRLRAELMEDESTQQKFISDIEQLERMVGESLEFARGVKIEENRQILDLNSLISSIVDDLMVEENTIPVRGNAIAPIKGLPDQLRRCFSNLFNNALFYADNVQVGITEEGGQVVVTITDDGPGIPEEELDQVLKPYYRVAKDRNRNTGGSGLGLAIVKNIVRSHQGTITLNNRTDRSGLIATLRFPKAQS